MGFVLFAAGVAAHLAGLFMAAVFGTHAAKLKPGGAADVPSKFLFYSAVFLSLISVALYGGAFQWSSHAR